jgi:hypothetical protein
MRLPLALALGVAVGLVCLWYQLSFERGAGDFGWPLCAARELLAGHDPYACTAGPGLPTNMLPTALFVAPLIALPPAWAAGLIIGLATALLVWGLLREGELWRLGVLLAFPFWQCVQVANWTILLLAICAVPGTFPLLIVKPHAAIPVAALRLSWRGLLLGALPVALSFLLVPDWPLRWWVTARSYSGGSLLLQTPLATLGLLALLRWREEAARYFVLCLLAPLRAFYDYLLLFALPQTPRQLGALVIGSWLAYLAWYLWPTIPAPITVLVGIYLPCLYLILTRQITAIAPPAGRMHHRDTEGAELVSLPSRRTPR